jgi:hypothetical protein
MRCFFLLLLVWVTTAVFAQQPTWYVFSREDGCLDLQVLAKIEKLSRTPESPDDFAQMLREQGEAVTIGKPSGFPAELTGQVVQVNVGSSKAPIFVKDEVCRNIGK